MPRIVEFLAQPGDDGAGASSLSVRCSTVMKRERFTSISWRNSGPAARVV